MALVGEVRDVVIFLEGLRRGSSGYLGWRASIAHGIEKKEEEKGYHRLVVLGKKDLPEDKVGQSEMHRSGSGSGRSSGFCT